MKNIFLLIILGSVIIIGCNKQAAEAVSKEEKPAEPEKATTVNKSDYDKKVSYEKQAQIKQAAFQKMKEAGELQPIATSTDQSYKQYYQSGYEKHNSGDFAGAIADFSRAIELNPQFGAAYGFRGMSKLKSGDTTGACADWQKAVENGYSRSSTMIDNYCH